MKVARLTPVFSEIVHFKDGTVMERDHTGLWYSLTPAGNRGAIIGDVRPYEVAYLDYINRDMTHRWHDGAENGAD